MKKIIRSIIRFFLKILYIFPVNEKKVYLMNFKGDKYGLDAKAFAEYLKTTYPNEYDIFWEILDLKKAFNVEGVTCIGKHSILGIYHYMTAGIILTNMTPRSYIPFRKKQCIINTWHGYPMKKVGKYAIRYNKDVYSVASCFASHSMEYTNIVLKDSFEYEGQIVNCGVPRNDIFYKNNTTEVINQIKKSLGVTGNVFLYAPTFRGDYQYEESQLDVQRLIKTLTNKTGESWTVLFRLHPQLADKISVNTTNTVDVSKYPDMQELLLISDALITDYSSCAWDFAQTGRPVFLFATDLEHYVDDRGLYYPLSDLPYPLAESNDELMAIIENFDAKKYGDQLTKYFKRVDNYETGNACSTLLSFAQKYHEKN